ncbi:MAG: zinc metallopeptidase [Acutalibacteraceae bacterium]|nr:zinc metallopeptidase [Clostridiales bacterium]
MFFYFDPWYLLLVLPAVILAGIAQLWVQSTFRKYSKVGTLRGVTGREASEEIQRRNGITLPVERVGGNLTDHYDPRTNVIRLSDPVYGVNSVAAVGVAAHETGHALQYAKGYAPIRLRAAILPVTQIGSTLSPYLVLLGLLFETMNFLAWAGIFLFGLSVLFQLITLPVEFNASARALKALSEGGMMTSEELAGARKVLTAAAMTYVAALFVSLMSLFRLILMVMSRSRRD